jgi:predicted PurR-regulated permease PerM
MPIAALIALGSGASPILVVVYIIVYAIYQQIENIFIQPRIMQRAVGINPIITLMGVLVGTQLAGVAGALITIPAVVVIQILLTDYMEHKES